MRRWPLLIGTGGTVHFILHFSSIHSVCHATVETAVYSPQDFYSICTYFTVSTNTTTTIDNECAHNGSGGGGTMAIKANLTDSTNKD